MVYESAKIMKSPLRYPGGKGSFYPYFLELMMHNGINGGTYLEPFAGGAGIALALISLDIVSNAIINDADYHIYCFWLSILNKNKQFIDMLQKADITLEEWKKQKEIYCQPRKYTVLEVGFATFYLNRCNRSGILAGAGPIGGYAQNGKWKLNARFNKENLIQRIQDIQNIKSRIEIKNMDAIDFLRNHVTNDLNRSKSLVYIDPPYISAGKRLYLNFYSNEDHKKLANYLLNQKNLNWVVTYDDNNFVRELYSSCQQCHFCLGYSLQVKQKGQEILIAPDWVHLPDGESYNTNRWTIIG